MVGACGQESLFELRWNTGQSIVINDLLYNRRQVSKILRSNGQPGSRIKVKFQTTFHHLDTIQPKSDPIGLYGFSYPLFRRTKSAPCISCITPSQRTSKRLPSRVILQLPSKGYDNAGKTSRRLRRVTRVPTSTKTEVSLRLMD